MIKIRFINENIYIFVNRTVDKPDIKLIRGG